jgi:fatty-acyl-CoA synthase
MTWILGDLLDKVGSIVNGDAPATIHDNRIVTWPEFTRASNNLARAFLAAGARTDDKVAFYMRNRPEYSECFAACVKARLIHVNVNYRYRHDELHYILDNADAVVIVYAAEFRENIQALKPDLPKVRLYVEITDGGASLEFAQPYEALANTGDGRPLGIERSIEDGLFIYTGGTTGMPKGVMWRAGDFYQGILDVGKTIRAVPANPDQLFAAVAANGRGLTSMPTCPLMHGTGFALMLGTLVSGGAVLTLPAASFDADEAWAAVDRHRADRMNIVGDAFAAPLARALDAAQKRPGGRYDLSCVESISSSGVMWSMENKQALLAHLPEVMLIDSFGASEALGFGGSVMTKDGVVATGKFTVSETARVLDEDGRDVVPGSGQSGWLAAAGCLPQGYYKDPEKTAQVFKTYDGVRYAIPGDHCLVEADGTMTLLGRGSICINSGGEKIFPEEVEEVLKTHDLVTDALVVGVPDERWGQAVTAVVDLVDGTGREDLDEAALRQHVHDRLAGYKVPKRVLAAEIPLRAANGKADYKAVRHFAADSLGTTL